MFCVSLFFVVLSSVIWIGTMFFQCLSRLSPIQKVTRDEASNNVGVEANVNDIEANDVEDDSSDNSSDDSSDDSSNDSSDDEAPRPRRTPLSEERFVPDVLRSDYSEMLRQLQRPEDTEPILLQQPNTLQRLQSKTIC